MIGIWNEKRHLKYATILNANKIKMRNINEKNMQLTIWVQLRFFKI